jgi:hypothetical protein
MKGKRTQQNRINNAKYRTVRSYAERQGQNCYGRKAWVLAQLPQRITKLRKRDVHAGVLEKPSCATQWCTFVSKSVPFKSFAINPEYCRHTRECADFESCVRY